MWTRRPDSAPFRPAPFPVYPENTGRLALERWLRVSRLLCVAVLLLVPVFAGPSSELAFPVSYARVELDERAPVLLELALPFADYRVAPASLGYFTDSGHFVYSGEVARGLIYGRSDREVLVVEIAAPSRAELYLDLQLDAIREQVAAVNRSRNQLRLERGRNLIDGGNESGAYLAALLEQLGPDLDGALPDDLSELRPAAGRLDGEELADAFIDYSRHRARLKELYYDSQSARLALMLRKFDLQLALARLPQPELEALLIIGDEKLVRDTMLKGIERLELAWDTRSGQLKRQLAADRQLLTLGGRAPLEQPSELAGEVGLPAGTDGWLLPRLPDDGTAAMNAGIGGSPDAASLPRLADAGPREARPVRWTSGSLVEARLAIAAAELAQLRACLSELSMARRHVLAGGLPAWTELPRHAPRLTQLQLKGLEALTAFALVEAEAREPRTAAPLLLSLAQEFERPQAPGNSGPATEWQLGPDEVAYGLLAVDRCRRGDAGQDEDGQGSQAMQALLSTLDSILAFPADYDTAAFNLGYLEFIRWYAALDAAGAFAGSEAPAAPAEDQPDDPAATEDQESAHQADVDELFN